MNLLSLEQIFENKLFRIPDYQRGYAWTEEQLKEFWEDLLNLPQKSTHYTGMISLEKIENKNEIEKHWRDEMWLIDKEDYEPYYIVDGQQRITTFLIFINELLGVLKDVNPGKKEDKIIINNSKISEIKKKFFVVVEEPDKILKAFKFGYIVDNPSDEYYRYKILGERFGGKLNETLYTKNLDRAKEIFHINLLELYKQKNGKEELEILFKKITKNFKFNLHIIEKEVDVYMTFETMNNRGKRLSHLELLKNRLIYLVTLFSNSEVDDERKRVVRVEINKAWKTIYSYLGKDKYNKLQDDVFLQDHATVYYRTSRPSEVIERLLKREFSPNCVIENTYSQFIDPNTLKNIADKTNKINILNISNYVNSINDVAKAWFEVFYPSESVLDEEEKLWVERINRLGIAHFRPLLTAIYCKDIDREKRIKLLKAIEKYIIFVFRIGGWKTTYNENKYYTAANDIYTDKTTIDNIIEDLHTSSSYILIDNKYINFEAIRGNINRLFDKYDGFYSLDVSKYILFEYEYNLYKQKNGVQKIWFDSLINTKDKNKMTSIEHVYPQTPTKQYWVEKFSGFNDKEKHYLNSSIGNLVILSLKINKQLQNDGFNDKKESKYDIEGNCIRRGYKEGSYAEMEIGNKEQWTANEILERGRIIIDFIEKRWDVKFTSTREKYQFLGLEFLIDEENYIDDKINIEVKHEIKEKGNKIITEMIEELYELAKQVFEGAITSKESIHIMTEVHNMNSKSATIYIDCFLAMMQGKVYKREMSLEATKYYIERIKQEYDEGTYKLALGSLEEHIDYKLSRGNSIESLQKILDISLNELDENKKLS